MAQPMSTEAIADMESAIEAELSGLESINVGVLPNDRTGDTRRRAGQKINNLITRTASISRLLPVGLVQQVHYGTGTTDVTSSNPSGGVASATTDNAAAMSHTVTQPDNHSMSGSTGSASVPTLPPFIVVYFWRRTA